MVERREPLDDSVFSRPEFVQFFGGLNEDTGRSSMHYYFAESPFFDQTSNNASLLTQAMYNPSMQYIRDSRQALEGALRGMQGLEYVLANEPSAPHNNGIWIIRKQNRRKVASSSEDEITVLATYYIVGDNIIQAPSVGNILQSKIFSMASSLNKLFSSASALPLFTPALGITYYAQNVKPSNSTTNTQTTQRSREDTTQSESQNQLPEAKVPTTKAHTTSSDSDAFFLPDSFRNFLQYRNEYMDENPLRGEPGSFVLSSRKEHLQQQASPKGQSSKLQSDLKQSVTPRASVAPTPEPQPKPAPVRKSSKSGDTAAGDAENRPKPRRRKSKITANSPTSST